MEEIVPIVDVENNIVSYEPRSVMRRKKLPHRASYIVLKNSNDRFYIEVRTLIKDYCPGMLDACIGGVVQKGEDDICLSASRELQEELGVKTDLEFLGWQRIDGDNTFTYAGLFYGEYDGAVIMQESEVSDVLMMTIEQIEERAAEFTPDSKIALREILKRKAETVERSLL